MIESGTHAFPYKTRPNFQKTAKALASALLVGSLLVTSAACKRTDSDTDGEAGIDAPPPAIAESEPNDERGTAQHVNGAATIGGSFTAGDKGDVDWFKLNADPIRIVRFELRIEEGPGATLEVFNADLLPRAKLRATSESPAVLPNETCEIACYVKLTPIDGKAGGQYALTVVPSHLHPRSEREPNDSRETAQQLEPGRVVDGYLAHAGDEDWYRVPGRAIGRNEALSFALTPPRTVRAEVSVIGPQGNTLVTWRAPEPGEALRMRNLSPPGGGDRPFHLVVRGVPQGAGDARSFDPETPYSLELRTVPLLPESESEPNDTAALANALGDGNGSLSGFLAPAGDVDWYAFEAATPSVLRAEVSGVDGVDLALSVLVEGRDGRPQEKVRVDDGGPGESEILAGVLIPAGHAWIRVDGGSGGKRENRSALQASTTSTYQLTVALDEDDGSFEVEPNDTYANATLMEVGTSIRGHIHPAGDVDRYRLEVHETMDVVVTVSGVPRLDLSLRIRDGSQSDSRGAFPIIGSIDRNRVEGDERLVIPLEPGSYFIEVRSRDGVSNPRQTYTLTAK